MSISRLITKELGTSIHNFRAKTWRRSWKLWWILEIEKRAIEHGAKESKKYDILLDEVINYLFKRDKVSKFEKWFSK